MLNRKGMLGNEHLSFETAATVASAPSLDQIGCVSLSALKRSSLVLLHHPILLSSHSIPLSLPVLSVCVCDLRLSVSRWVPISWLWWSGRVGVIQGTTKDLPPSSNVASPASNVTDGLWRRGVAAQRIKRKTGRGDRTTKNADTNFHSDLLH